jgi:hypothetical protein
MLQDVIEQVDEALRQQLAKLPFLFNKNMKLVKASDVYVIDNTVSTCSVCMAVCASCEYRCMPAHCNSG